VRLFANFFFRQFSPHDTVNPTGVCQNDGQEDHDGYEIRFYVRWLDVASKAVRPLLGTVLDGMTNGTF
jgi:hypothetical protein